MIMWAKGQTTNCGEALIQKRKFTEIWGKFLGIFMCAFRSLRQSASDGSLVNPYRFVKMLSFLGTGSSSLRGLGSSSRSYSTGTSTTSKRPALVWNHGHASTKPQQQVQLPESSHGVSSELIAKMRRLREEAPKTFTARRLMANFNLPKKTINAVAPYVRHGKAVRFRLSASLKADMANFAL